jgi:DNA invertase Pin-like site-specific DNA recombinase
VAGTAGPGQTVPVAFIGRTSTLMQDPVASLRRQVRKSQDWLPPGFRIVAWYWDVESGGLDLEARSKGDNWQAAAGAGIPRDGGMADLLRAARSPEPPFAFVVCEDIERSARDNYNSLKLERKLRDEGIAIFATDEPFTIEGVNATTILVRRVKQGVAEWYRLQLKEKVWEGLKEHNFDGWNIGTIPYGYVAERHTHPNPMKEAQGRTKTRLAADPDRGPVITQMFSWRVTDRLGVPTIRARLNANRALYPPPDAARGWTSASIYKILANPKYTGYQVLGRRHRASPGKVVTMPPEKWIWSRQPTHPALVDKATWDEAQKIGGERGNVQDREQPRPRPGRRYRYRGRLWCKICKRRMRGVTRMNVKRTITYTYYQCPHDPGHLAHAAAHPSHPTVAIREETLTAAAASFFTQYVFGPDRAAMLAAQLPADAEHEAAQRQLQARRLDKRLAQIELAQQALITELETPTDPGDPAALALRERVRARYRELHGERATLETQRDQLDTATSDVSDPALLDQLPILGDIITGAPAGLTEQLFEAFNVQAVYNKQKQQITIRVTITDATPQAITELLNDPRLTPGTPLAKPQLTSTSQAFSHSANHQGAWWVAHCAHDGGRRRTGQGLPWPVLAGHGMGGCRAESQARPASRAARE